MKIQYLSYHHRNNTQSFKIYTWEAPYTNTVTFIPSRWCSGWWINSAAVTMANSNCNSSCAIEARERLYSAAQSFFTLVSQSNLDFYIMNCNYSPRLSSHLLPTWLLLPLAIQTLHFAAPLCPAFFPAAQPLWRPTTCLTYIMVDPPLPLLPFYPNLCTCMQQFPLVYYTVRYANILPSACPLSFLRYYSLLAREDRQRSIQVTGHEMDTSDSFPQAV